MKTIFVSSTFKDMQYERDAIRYITAPSLNEEARKHGDEVDFCDLRWGINTGDLDTEESSKKVLDVCLDEIDRSEPPMVVLLGYRYGWIPDAGLIKTAADRKQLELEDLEKSVTALEIEYGALCDERKFKNTLFYFREIEGYAPSDYLAEDREHEEKIAALKNRIKSITGGKVRTYTLKWNGSGFDGIDDFAMTLVEDIKERLMPEWLETEKLSDFQRERRMHAAFIQEKNAMFMARQAEAEKLMKDALSQPVTIIKGEVGSGKSTLFSHMATKLEKSGWTVLPFISGLTMQSNSVRDIIENTIYFIEEELHLDHIIDEADPKTSNISRDTGNDEDETDSRTDEEKNRADVSLIDRCKLYIKSGAKLLIMVDAADQLAHEDTADQLAREDVDRLFLPTSVSDNIHFVMTCTTDFKTPGREQYTLEQLNDEDKLDVVKGILARSRKEISNPVISGMLDLKASDNPLYLSLLVQRLLMMNMDDFADIGSRGDGMTAIEQYQLGLIRNKCPDDLDKMNAALLNEAGKRINEELISKVAQYLAASRYGLRKKDMAALLGEEWSEIDFSKFVVYMQDSFLQRDDGRLDFTHKSIRAGFRSLCQDWHEANRKILEHFKSLEEDDPIRMNEIIYYTIAADDIKFFIDYIVKHEQDSRIIGLVTRDIYAQCISDNGRWITNALYEAKKYEDIEKLCTLTRFCNFDLNRAFERNREDLDIRLSFLTANLSLSKCLYNKFVSDVSVKALSDSYRMTAEIYADYYYRVYYDSFQLTRALEMYEWSLTLKEQLVLKLYQLNELYEAIPANNEQQIEKFRTDASKNFRRSNGDDADIKVLSDVYCDAAKLCRILGDSDSIKRALELYEKDLTIWELLTEKPGAFESKRDLSDKYRRAAGIYEELGGSDNIKRALELHEKNLTIRMYLLEYWPDNNHKCNLSYSYEEVAGLYKELGGSDNLKRALELHEMSLTIREQLAAALDTRESKWDLSFSYDRAAGIYEELGGSDNIKRALELYEKSLTVREQPDAEFSTSLSKWFLFLRYINTAGIYEELGGSDNIKRARGLREKNLAIWEQLAAELGGSDDIKRARELEESILTFKKQPAKEAGASQSKSDLSISYRRDAKTRRELGGGDEILRAVELYEKDLTRREQLAAESDAAQSKRLFLLRYISAAKVYDTLEFRFDHAVRGRNLYPDIIGIGARWRRENATRALELCEKCLTIHTQLATELGTAQSKRDLSLSYYAVAEIYEEYGGYSGLTNARLALDRYEKGLIISEQLAAELDTAQSKRDLSVFYNTAAGINMKLRGDENLMQALDLYEKELIIREQLAKELDTIQSKRELSGSYHRVAGIYKQLGGSDNIKRVLELYEKELIIREQLAKEQSATENKKDLSFSYHKAAEIYKTLGGSENLKRALELYEKGLTINKQLVKELGTVESKRNLSDSYNKTAGIYDELDGSDNLKRALELYEKNLAINKQLAKKTGTEHDKEKLSDSYDMCAASYEDLGGRRNLKRALKLYEKSLRISESTGLDAFQRKFGLSYDYYHIAEIYEELGGRRNLKRAHKLREKGLMIDK